MGGEFAVVEYDERMKSRGGGVEGWGGNERMKSRGGGAGGLGCDCSQRAQGIQVVGCRV